ncbi:hypothetical protein [Bosea sp. (in: a-proteobacteria)]|uniref:hypothetical protein n=1 Tax=Bosea sp. (in: a-proteobacteria) TaxID=1871050 RepID=UPI0012098AAE|nr:hypothetical protein [Bosea sp. (in: a-proteobacteria)]TAJ30925.1 MAG: hypothetical protein EPO59_09880 [Bosea sp. (in: a-proteobacteria)]
MDFGSPPRITAIAGSPAISRSDVSTQPGSVAVDLAPEKTVQSASAGGAVQLDIRPETRRQAKLEAQAEQAQASDDNAALQRSQQALQRRVVIEQNTHSVVVQERDPRTGETVSMVPDEATLRLRLFARALAERGKAPPVPGQSVEVTA